jgi:hypothetical protein
MSESKRSQRNLETVPESQAAYWSTIHHHWWFWFALALMLTAMTVYGLSDNVSLFGS